MKWKKADVIQKDTGTGFEFGVVIESTEDVVTVLPLDGPGAVIAKQWAVCKTSNVAPENKKAMAMQLTTASVGLAFVRNLINAAMEGLE